MNMNRIKMMAAALSTAALVACGGGGDVAGDSMEFTTNVDEWTVKALRKGECPGAGNEVWVTIVGGQPPFRIRNPMPTVVQVDRTETSGKDPVFKVTTLGTACAEFSITVHDYHSQMAAVEIKLEEGSEEEELPDAAP